MQRRALSWIVGWALLGWLLTGGVIAVAAEGPVVRAVLFYSPSCGHCHHVIEEVLPPLAEQYGSQFEIVGINVADPEGQALYQAAVEHFDVPPERRGVPTLIIGETVLVGSVEIPTQLPDLIETQLAQGGVDWPAVPGLAETLATSEPAPTASLASTPGLSPTPSSPEFVSGDGDWRARFARDPLGNGISLLVLLFMIASLLYHVFPRRVVSSSAGQQRWQWAVPLLVVLGLIVAGYLAYVETQQVTAICGPVGDCNAVQQSEYALLFGILPIAVLGLMGYLAIGVAWIVMRYGRGLWADAARWAMVVMVWLGVLFSIYLTFLEPFVIGATCAWCLTSAVLVTLLLWVVAPLLPRALPRST
jgi:uncharacterized membrane protein/thiol-disulfide isomerase/thioredoxin